MFLLRKKKSPSLILFLLAISNHLSPIDAIFGARKLGSPHWDAVHERIKAVKRDGGTCPTGSYLCGPDFNGGCCPTDRGCGLTDCPPLNTGLLTVTCAEAGYTACPVQYGGCCPSGYQCGRNDCTPPSGATVTSNNCGPGSYLCPSEFNYGCCRSDRDCGLTTCPPRTTSSFLYTISVTTTDVNGSPSTQVTVVTTVYVPITSSPTVSVVSKVPPASSTSTSDSGAKGTSSPSNSPSGLSKGAIGGLTAGIAVCVIAVFVASYLTLRKLQSASKKSERSETVVPTARSDSGDNDPAMTQVQRPEVSYYSGSYYSGDGAGGQGGYQLVSPSEELASESGQPGQARNYSFDSAGRGHFSPNSDTGSWPVGHPRHERTVSDESVPSVAEGRVYQTPDEIGRRPRRDTQMTQVSELDNTEVIPDSRRGSRDRASTIGAPGRPSFASSRRSSGQGEDLRYAHGSSGERVRLADLPEVNTSGTFHESGGGGGATDKGKVQRERGFGYGFR